MASELMPSIAVPPLFEERARFKALGWIAKKSAKNADAVAMCSQFSESGPWRAPLISGRSGTGKTHLLWAMARRMVDRQRELIEDMMSLQMIARMEAMVDRGDFWEPPRRADWPAWYAVEVVSGAELAHNLRSSIDRGTTQRVVEHYQQKACSSKGAKAVLFIDDIEVMKMGDWLGEELYRIIDSRYVNAMPTCVVSNLGISELASHFGDRIARRIFDMTEPVVLT